ncbi:hypothetical protein Lrub_0593 [Legionella rubrilucens]|uniref:Uncharacterized protein n=1 Tax=Legionella rubrilucens TaxID=458 RepID=A0A0W0XYN8_9GAMM|nr:hypothetical protein [Legionella rubrilucens]KTD49494.1 hypothetical protein Lrub_0593 [Legionella rubrilucens]
MTKSMCFFIGLTLFCRMLSAAGWASVSFFASNNTGIIQPEQAYQRLLSEAQSHLKNTMITILQAHHMEQSQCEDGIGMYQMAGDGRLTADNGKIFTTSPYQKLTDETVLALSQQMATALHQESVAVFIPDEQAETADTTVHLNSHHYPLSQTIRLIHERLPADYTQAFTLHFDSKYGGFDQATISGIEWLGRNIDPAVIQTAFPEDKITTKHGKAFLVFKDGQVKTL